MTTAAIYLRVSTRHQAEDGFSLGNQRTTLSALAASRGWDHTIYEDAGISGETLDERPGMLALLAAVDRANITPCWWPTSHGSPVTTSPQPSSVTASNAPD